MMSSLSIVCVISGEAPSQAWFNRTLAAASAVATDVDMVIVANAVTSQVSLALQQIVQTCPDTVCLFLGNRVDDDLACITGIDNAVGDYVLIITPEAGDIAALPEFVKAAEQGYDLVTVRPGTPRAGAYPLAQRLFYALYEKLTDTRIAVGHSPFRLLSRPAALHLISRPDAEMLLKADGIGPGFSATRLPLGPFGASSWRRGFRSAFGKALRALVGATSRPLRLVTFLSAAAGAFSILYSFYVVAIYLFSRDVERGWTTLSLQVSVMMFTLSISFLLLSEYVLQIHATSPTRARRVPVVREVRSAQTRSGTRLNVVNADGEFQLGATDAEPVVTPSASRPLATATRS